MLDFLKEFVLTVISIDFVALFLESLEFNLMTLKVGDGLTDEGLELLEHDNTVHLLLAWH